MTSAVQERVTPRVLEAAAGDRRCDCVRIDVGLVVRVGDLVHQCEPPVAPLRRLVVLARGERHDCPDVVCVRTE